MQVLDEQKRLKILSAAAELFATQPFHKVLLSDVAEAAAVGKGTLYTYFSSKEDLYISVLFSGFSDLLARLRAWIDGQTHSPVENMEAMVREFVSFAFQNPHHFELMRTVQISHAIDHAKWDGIRREMNKLIESVIRKGIDQGVFEDPHPDLTARIIPGCVRSLMIDGIHTVDAPAVTAHILRFVLSALKVKRKKS